MSEGQFMSDEDIAKRYEGINVTETVCYTVEGHGGMAIEFKGGAEARWENFSEFQGRITFEQWYPDPIHEQLSHIALAVLRRNLSVKYDRAAEEKYDQISNHQAN